MQLNPIWLKTKAMQPRIEDFWQPNQNHAPVYRITDFKEYILQVTNTEAPVVSFDMKTLIDALCGFY